MMAAAHMRRCESFTPTGASLLLTWIPAEGEDPDRLGRQAAWVVDRSLGLFEPLAADLLFGPRFTGEPFLDEDTQVAQPTWHVRREDLGAERGVRPAFQRAGHQERRVASIDGESIGRVMEEAMRQQPPPDRRVAFALLEVKNTRARLLDPQLAGAASITVSRGRFDYPVPVVRDARGSWIDAIPDALERPLALHVDNVDGALRVKLDIAWSLWKDEGSAEQRAVLDFARALVAGGYTIEHADRELRSGLGV